MNRRGFFSSLAGLTAGMALDPERLLWKPGAKTISIPRRSEDYLLDLNGQVFFNVIGREGNLTGNTVVYVRHLIDGKLAGTKELFVSSDEMFCLCHSPNRGELALKRPDLAAALSLPVRSMVADNPAWYMRQWGDIS